MYEYFKKRSEKIRSGEKYTLYLLYCTYCKEYKSITASPPAGPGGTLSCPMCRSKKVNGPHIEGAYGCVKAKSFQITLPRNVDIFEVD